MWDLIVSVPDHCLSFYFDNLEFYHMKWLRGPKRSTQGRLRCTVIPLTSTA